MKDIENIVENENLEKKSFFERHNYLMPIFLPVGAGIGAGVFSYLVLKPEGKLDGGVSIGVGVVSCLFANILYRIYRSQEDIYNGLED